VAVASEDFVRAYQAGARGNDDYPPFVASLRSAFAQTAELAAREELDLASKLTPLERQLTPRATQKAHRDFLLAIEALRGVGQSQRG